MKISLTDKGGDNMDTAQEELIRRLTAERDSYKDLVEWSAILMAVMKHGKHGCIGKRVNIDSYIYVIAQDGNGYKATLITSNAGQ